VKKVFVEMAGVKLISTNAVILLMGVREAVQVLDILQRERCLSTRLVHDYVLEALYLGPDLLEGTPEYEGFIRSLYAELAQPTGAAGDELGGETAYYLREILATAGGMPRGPLMGVEDFDGYSEEAYQEVQALLGRQGRSYLGLRGSAWSLKPSRTMISAFIHDEEAARAEYARRAAGSGGPPVRRDEQYGSPWEFSDATWAPLAPDDEPVA